MPAEAPRRIYDRPIEIFLLCRNGQNHEPTPEPRVDRPGLTGPLLRPQLKQVRLALQ